MKRFFKWLGALLGVAVLVLVVFVVNAIWFKPFSINVFYERVFMQYALDDPELLSSIRILEQFGLKFHQDDLTSESLARTEKLNKMVRDDLETLHRYGTSDMTPAEKTSYDVLDWFLTMQVEGQQWTYNNYPVNQMFGVQSSLPDFMVQIHQVNDEGDAADYVARLEKFDWKFDQVLEQLRYRENHGIVPPHFVVVKVLKEMRAFIDHPPEEHLLYTKLQEKLDKAGIPGDDQEPLLTDAAIAIRDHVYPAYQSLIGYFAALEPKATANNGIWALPDGDAYYAYLVRYHTTTDMTPEQVHQIGLSEVDRIQTQMDAILKSEGYTEGTVGQRMMALGKEERFLYPDTDAGREQILADYQSILDEVNAGLEPYFGVRPSAGVEVRRVPEFKEATAPGAYYQSPSLDGTRPGVFYANLRDVTETPRFGMRTLAYHEGIPGHHFQKAIQQEIKDVPTFRRLLGFTAFAEGWALYAERLAWELGFEDDPYDNLGRLQAELFRAVRLVVDTGIHYKRWSREEAIAYMESNTGMAHGDVVSEIERYFVMPGQALAYKVGMLKLLALREKAKTALGDDFDIRGFHDLILTGGDMPLDILEQRVDHWIAEQQRPDGRDSAAHS